MFKPQDIHSVLKPMVYATKIIGYSPFSLNKNNYDKHSFIDLSWSLSLMILLGGIASFSLRTRDDDAAVITKVTDYLHTRLNVISFCGVICFACLYARKVRRSNW